MRLKRERALELQSNVYMSAGLIYVCPEHICTYVRGTYIRMWSGHMYVCPPDIHTFLLAATVLDKQGRAPYAG